MNKNPIVRFVCLLLALIAASGNIAGCKNVKPSDKTTVEYDDSVKLTYKNPDSEVEIYKCTSEVNIMKSLDSYLKNLTEKYNTTDIRQTGMTRENYADIVALCISEYNKINNLKTITIDQVSYTLQTYSRIVSSLAVLCAGGDVTKYRLMYNDDFFADNADFLALFEKMMTAACYAAAYDYAGKDVENFAVKEIMLAYLLTKDRVDEKNREGWFDTLSKITPSDKYYTSFSKTNNRNVYVMGGEQIRTYLGMADSTAFVDASFKRQATHFNSLGMYLDNYSSDMNHNPTLYDLTTRVQLQLVTAYGYKGQYAEKMNKILRDGGLVSLFMQSADFQLSYGGRSNQFLFNEALLSSNFEYEASYYASKGDEKTAGVFKRAAHLATLPVSDWLKSGKDKKNYYKDATVGADDYGTYDKYMITMSSFLAIGYLFADDSIKEMPCPAELGGYVFHESDNFRIIIANAGGYSIEIMTSADNKYDCTGLGRIHKSGIPSELGLSMPFTATPHYNLPAGIEKDNISIDVGWKDADGNSVFLADFNDLDVSVYIIEESAAAVEFEVRYTGASLSGTDGIIERYRLTGEGLDVQIKLINPVYDFICYTVPLLKSNGDGLGSSSTKITTSEAGAKVTMGEYNYSVNSDGNPLTLSEGTYYNRNGEYYVALIKKNSDSLSVKLSLDKIA